MGSGGVEKKVRAAGLKELPGSVPPGPASDTGASGPERGRDSLGLECRPLSSAASGFCLSPLLTWENCTPACESVSWGSVVSSLPSRGAVICTAGLMVGGWQVSVGFSGRLSVWSFLDDNVTGSAPDRGGPTERRSLRDSASLL